MVRSLVMQPFLGLLLALCCTDFAAAVSPSYESSEIVYDVETNTVIVSAKSSKAGSYCLLASLSLGHYGWKQNRFYPTEAASCPVMSKWDKDLLFAGGSNSGENPFSLTLLPTEGIEGEIDEESEIATLPGDSSAQMFPESVTSLTEEPDIYDDSPPVVVLGIEHKGKRKNAGVLDSTDAEHFKHPGYWIHNSAATQLPTLVKYADPTNEKPLWKTALPIDIKNEDKFHLAPQVVGINGVTLVVAGSTYSDSTNTAEGFLIFVNSTSGDIIEGYGQDQAGVAGFHRYPDSEKEWVTGICHNSKCDSGSCSNSVYLVGATTKSPPTQHDSNTFADVHLQGFVKKFDLDTFEVSWTKYWGAQQDNNPSHPAQAFAMSCAAVDSTTLMVAGGVENGAAIMEGNHRMKQSNGGDDVWMAELDSRFGTVAKTLQFGSEKDDRLAHGNGLVVDHYGDVVMVGDTLGALTPTGVVAKSRSIESQDSNSQEAWKLFAIYLNRRTGRIKTITSADASFLQGDSFNDGESDPTAEFSTNLPANSNGQKITTPPPTETFATLPPKIPEESNGDDSSGLEIDYSSWGAIDFALAVMGIISLCCCCAVFVNTQSEREHNKLIVDRYMQPFSNVESKKNVTNTGGCNVTFTKRGQATLYGDLILQEASAARRSSGKYFEDEPQINLHDVDVEPSKPKKSIYDYVKGFKTDHTNVKPSDAGGWKVSYTEEAILELVGDSDDDSSCASSVASNRSRSSIASRTSSFSGRPGNLARQSSMGSRSSFSGVRRPSGLGSRQTSLTRTFSGGRRPSNLTRTRSGGSRASRRSSGSGRRPRLLSSDELTERPSRRSSIGSQGSSASGRRSSLTGRPTTATAHGFKTTNDEYFEESESSLMARDASRATFDAIDMIGSNDSNSSVGTDDDLHEELKDIV